MSFIKNTDVLVEGSSNLFFSEERAQNAVVENSIASGTTDKAPAQQAVYNALSLKLDTSLKGASGGLAELDGSGKIPSSQLPAIAITDVSVVADNAARDALTVEEGDVAITTDSGKSWIFDGTGWQELKADGKVVSVNGETGAVTLDTDDIDEGMSPTNKWFTEQRAKDAAVVNSSSGSETDQAMSVSAAKLYSEGQAAAASGAALSGAEAYTDLKIGNLEGYEDVAGLVGAAVSGANSYTDQAVSGLASEQYVDEAVSGLASESYVNTAVSGLASEQYVDQAVSGLASESYVNTAVSGLASESYVDQAVSGLASESYVDLAVSGLASESYVNSAVSGLASETYVDNAEFAAKTEVGPISTASSNASLGDEILVLCNVSGGTITLTLPAASGCADGRRYIIKDNGSAASGQYVRIQRSGSNLIDGQQYYDIKVPYESVTVFTDQSNWYII
jgi:hypothetical protein